MNALPDGRRSQVRDVGERVRDGRDLGGVEQQATVRVVDVHHRTSGEAGGEQARLGLEVALHRPVEVEVVAGEVREHGDREAGAVDAVQRERVRRHLHRHRVSSLVAPARELLLEVGRLGRRPRAR